MKKILSKLISVIFIFTVFLLGIRIYNKFQIKERLKEVRQHLPSFELNTIDGFSFSTKILSKNKPVCVIYYSPDCEHCEYELKSIKNHIDWFNNTEVLLISISDPLNVKKFIQKNNLEPLIKFIWLYDKNLEFHKWFGVALIPSIFIYDKNHNLLKEFHGEIMLNAIKPYL